MTPNLSKLRSHSSAPLTGLLGCLLFTSCSSVSNWSLRSVYSSLSKTQKTLEQAEIHEELEPLTVLPSHRGLLNGNFKGIRKPVGDPFPPQPLARLYTGDDSLGWQVVYGNVERITSEEPLLQPAGAGPDGGSGSAYLDLNGSEPGAIQQTVPTRKGQTYRVAFHLSGNANTDFGSEPTPVKKMAVWADAYGKDGGVFTFEVTKTADIRQTQRWETRVFKFRANSEKTTLTFASITPGAYGPLLTNVRLVPANDQSAGLNGDFCGPDYAMFQSPQTRTRKFENDLLGLQPNNEKNPDSAPKNPAANTFPLTSDGKSDGAEYGKLFTASVSPKGRYRLLARRSLQMLDLANFKHGTYDISLEITKSRRRLPFQQDLFLYHGALDGREGPKHSFHWHPSRQLLLAINDTARHWHTYGLWEVSDQGIHEVPAQKGGNSNDLSIKTEAIRRIQNANPSLLINPQNAPDGAICLGTMHSYEHFERWHGDEMVLGFDPDLYRLKSDSAATPLLDKPIEGRIRYVPAKPGVPAHFGPPRILQVPILNK